MYFSSTIVLCFLFLETFGRPTHVLQDYDKDSRDGSYRDSDSGETDDYQHDDRKSSLKQFSDGPDSNEEIDHAHSDKDYLENGDEQTDAAHLTPENPSNGIKRTAAHNNGILLFHDEIPQKMETNEYNADERVRPNHNNRYLKQYRRLPNVERDRLVRDRRQIQNNDLSNPSATETSTKNNDGSENENEETAIRRHVKKLSKEELDELLHSLSDDKRALLKNIIDNRQQDYDGINKREITKKAGANEENSLVGNEQSDTSKTLGGSANLEAESSLAPNFDKQDNTKKADTESMYSKSPETSNSSEKSNDKMGVLDSIADKTPVKSDSVENLDSSDTESKILGNPEAEKETPKKDSKREIDLSSSAESESIENEPTMLISNAEDLYCSDNEALAQLWNEESSLHNDNKYKRDVYSDSIKSLQESFPNPDNINNVKIGSDMAPSVRVKRDNPEKELDKTDENFASNLKVPYFSSALENNEEESNEGGEFQNDGFFDRGANFAKSSELAKRGIDTFKGNADKYCRNSQSVYVDKNKLETDTAGLGSDTDVVVAGIEGVDDNVMYNSVARVRRTGNTYDNSNVEGEAVKLRQENNQQLSLQNENNELSEDNNNAARYQENDAFGSLPRNYERDLGRFKRIRRLKPENNAVTV